MMIIYKPDFSNFHEITHAISTKFINHYNGVGKFTINLPIDDYNLDIAEINSTIYDTETKHSYIVVNRKIDTKSNSITINGYSSEWLLSKRAILEPKYYPATEASIYQLVNNNLRGLPIEMANSKGLGGTNDYVWIKEGQLINRVVDLANANEFGTKVNFDTKSKKFTFEVYKGVDRTQGLQAQIFSYERGTAQALIINEDISVYATKVFTSGTINETTYIENAGGGANENLIEYWINSNIHEQKEFPTEQDIRELKSKLRSICQAELSKHIYRQDFNVEINPDEYGTEYFLGDVVTCISKKFGVKFKKRITSVTHQLDTNGKKISLTLGEPILTKTEADKLGGY